MVRMKIVDILEACANVLVPAECPICGRRRTAFSLPICETCSHSLLAQHTLDPTPSGLIPEIWSCLPYNGIIKACIQEFKYRGKQGMTRVFSRLIHDYLDKKGVAAKAMDLIIPVPICANRLRKRRYNQSELIARTLSRALFVPISTHALLKTKNTPPQTGLSRNKRIRNIKGSFSALRAEFLAGKSILLVDDVMTTGATLDTCAKELLRSGAKEIRGFTLARTL